MLVIQSISNQFDGTAIIYLVSKLPFFESIKTKGYLSKQRVVFVKISTVGGEGGGAERGQKKGSGRFIFYFLNS